MKKCVLEAQWFRKIEKCFLIGSDDHFWNDLSCFLTKLQQAEALLIMILSCSYLWLHGLKWPWYWYQMTLIQTSWNALKEKTYEGFTPGKKVSAIWIITLTYLRFSKFRLRCVRIFWKMHRRTKEPGLKIETYQFHFSFYPQRHVHQKTCIRMFIAALFIIVQCWKQLTVPQ